MSRATTVAIRPSRRSTRKSAAAIAPVRQAWSLGNDGSVVRPMSVSDFPKLVAAVIAETAAGAKIEKSFRVEWRGKITTAPAGTRQPATASKLDTPEVIYRATLLSRQGERTVMEVDSAGNVVREPKWEMKEKKPAASAAPKPAPR